MLWRASLLVSLLLVVSLGCVEGDHQRLVSPPPQAIREATPEDSPPLREVPPAPDSDLFDITQRLGARSQSPLPRSMLSPPPARELGMVDTFTVTDLQSYTRSQVPATLRLITDHAYWFVDNSVEVDQPALESSSREFEDHLYATDIHYFGDTIHSGIDGDSHITVLLTRFNGAAGYYSSPDEYPKVVHPFSNQRVMLYINGNILRPGTSPFLSVVAHELQHAIHWHADPNEESWINEGSSTLAEELNGFRTPSARVLERGPDIQLTAWEDEPSRNGPHYAAAHMFLRFLMEHWGGYDHLKDLVAEPADGIAGINAYLEHQGFPVRFPDVFKHWVIANLGIAGIDPSYRYDGVQVRAQAGRRFNDTASLSDQVPQYGAKYFDVQPASGSATITFSGFPAARLLPTDAHDGRFLWWSNRGDSIDATLTRAVDLTAVSSATLQFWTWFDIEDGWDYAYVTVSTDGGRTWEVLRGSQASSTNPLGNSYGPGYTGKSGGGSQPAWVQESIDLSPYAGQQVLLRFEYITDEAVNDNGLALDDIEIPEIGFHDGAETDAGGWDSRGFLRTNNLVAQDYAVQVVQVAPDGSASVQEVTLDDRRKGRIDVCCFSRTLDHAVVAVAGMAPATTEPAHFQLSVEAHP